MPWALPDGPDAYVDLIRAVARPAFAVHLDVCNVINNPRRFYENSEIIRDCFRKLGPWIASCHAKDLSFIRETAFTSSKSSPAGGRWIIGHT